MPMNHYRSLIVFLYDCEVVFGNRFGSFGWSGPVMLDFDYVLRSLGR